MVDIVVAIVYITISFNFWFGLIVFVTMILYIGVFPLKSHGYSILSFSCHSWNCRVADQIPSDHESPGQQGSCHRCGFTAQLRNCELDNSNEIRNRIFQVKYYNAELYEVDRYRTSVENYQVTEK